MSLEVSPFASPPRLHSSVHVLAAASVAGCRARHVPCVCSRGAMPLLSRWSARVRCTHHGTLDIAIACPYAARHCAHSCCPRHRAPSCCTIARASSRYHSHRLMPHVHDARHRAHSCCTRASCCTPSRAHPPGTAFASCCTRHREPSCRKPSRALILHSHRLVPHVHTSVPTKFLVR